MTTETTLKMGKLARIALSESEADTYTAGLKNVLAWVEQLQEVDVSDVKIEHLPGPQVLTLRADVVCMTNTVNELMSNAPESKLNMFSVPKVVE